MIKEVMEDPGRFLFEVNRFGNQSKNTRKCLDIIRDFHYHFSVVSP